MKYVVVIRFDGSRVVGWVSFSVGGDLRPTVEYLVVRHRSNRCWILYLESAQSIIDHRNKSPVESKQTVAMFSRASIRFTSSLRSRVGTKGLRSLSVRTCQKAFGRLI